MGKIAGAASALACVLTLAAQDDPRKESLDVIATFDGKALALAGRVDMPDATQLNVALSAVPDVVIHHMIVCEIKPVVADPSQETKVGVHRRSFKHAFEIGTPGFYEVRVSYVKHAQVSAAVHGSLGDAYRNWDVQLGVPAFSAQRLPFALNAERPVVQAFIDRLPALADRIEAELKRDKRDFKAIKRTVADLKQEKIADWCSRSVAITERMDTWAVMRRVAREEPAETQRELDTHGVKEVVDAFNELDVDVRRLPSR